MNSNSGDEKLYWNYPGQIIFHAAVCPDCLNPFNLDFPLALDNSGHNLPHPILRYEIDPYNPIQPSWEIDNYHTTWDNGCCEGMNW